MEKQYQRNAKIFKAFCDENRLKIIDLLSSGEKCACILLEELSIGQSTLSHHMKILVDSGIVKGRKEGKWIYYSLDDCGCDVAKTEMENLLKKTDNNSKIYSCKCD